MIEPKIFYRKLDYLLSKIGKEKSGEDFLFYIVTKLEQTFGDDLSIYDGRIYQETNMGFELIFPIEGVIRDGLVKKISLNSKALMSIIKSRSYIFDNPLEGGEFKMQSSFEYSVPAGLLVHSPENRWVFVFDLKSGWVREEIEFCMNAVRRAINYRLFSEAVISEMQQAARIQQSLLPAAPPVIPGYDIAAYSIPAELVGGDLYDFYLFENDEFGFCLGDASGHGLPAALMVRDVVTGLRMGVEKHMKMVHTLKKLNEVIYRGAYSTSFISLFFAELEKNGNLFYANGGHPSPLLFNGSEVIELQPTGLIFGAFRDIDLHRAFAHIDIGGVLVIFTDGILERKNKDDEFYSVSEIEKIVKANLTKSAKEILELIFDHVEKFGNNSKWEDDATIMIIKRTE